MASVTGRVVIEKIPNKADRKKVAGFLFRISKNTSPEKVIGLISNLPVVLARNISAEKGSRLVLQLNKLGANARFIPATTVQKAKKTEKTAPKSSNIRASVLHKTDKTVVRQNVSKMRRGNAGANKGKKKAQKSKAGPRSHLVWILLPIAVVLAGYYFLSQMDLFSIPGWFHQLSDVSPSPETPAAKVDLFHDFDMSQTSSHDRRLANGLKRAFLLYTDLFLNPVAISVDVTSDQSGHDQYKLTYTVRTPDRMDQYDLILSTKSGKMKDNLNAAEAVMRAFIRKMAGQNDPFSGVLDVKKKSLSQLSYFISGFDYADLLKGLRFIENQLVAGKEGPALLLSSGEIFSWLAFFKNTNSNRELSDYLATHAVSSYLVGAAFAKKPEELSRYKGLLYLALDYPYAARQVLNSANMEEALITAFIGYDFDGIQKLTEKSGINKRLVSYLKARAFSKSRSYNDANWEYKSLLENYPDFLLANEYIADKSNVVVRQKAMPVYLSGLLSKQLDIVNEYFQTDWIKNNKKLDKEIRREVFGENDLVKWMKILYKICDGSERVKGKGKLLTADFLRRFLKMDMANALLSYYHMEADALGRIEEASKIVDIADNVFPDSQIAKALRLKYLLKFEKASDVFNFAVKIDNEQTGRYLLKEMLDAYLTWKSNFKNAPRIITLLKRYKALENPNARGLYALFTYYIRYHHKPYALTFLKSAIDTNPYYYYFYSRIAKSSGEKEYIEKGEAHIRHLYGFLTIAADFYAGSGEMEKGIAFYEEAIKNSPAQFIAYQKLGMLYKEQKDFKNAIATWEKFLKYDDNSLSGVSIQNAIGRTYLENGEYDKAYIVFRSSKESNQNCALLGFAEASEKTGKVSEAESYYLKALDRYPDSSLSATSVAIFYLRQNNEKAACDVLRNHKKYHHFSYYYKELVDYFAKKGKPEGAIKIVSEVENGKPPIWALYNLAEKYAQNGYAKIALQLYEPIMKNMEQPKKNQPYLFAALYLDHCKSEDTCNLDEKLSELLSLYGKVPPMVEQLGIGLIGNETFDAALKAFDEKFEKTQNRRDIALVMMALSWRLGSRPDLEKKKIIKRLKAFKKDQWTVDRVKFLLGDMNAQTILSRVDNQDKRCEIHYYLGVIRKSEGRTQEARKHLLSSLYTKAIGNIEYYYALEAIKKLD